jgi:formate/nitrite transporter FocA (FNT family)
MTMPRRRGVKEERVDDAVDDAPVPGGEGTRHTAQQIHDNIRKAAEEELERPAAALLWSGLAAGLAIAFSFFASAFLSSVVDEEHKKAAAAAGYPLGFIFVVLARQQLFTENTLEPVIPVLDRFTGRRLAQMLRLWALVLASNLVGALVIALVAALTPLFEDPGLLAAMERVADESTRGTFGSNFYKAIFGGWLVAMMAWLVGATRLAGAQIALVWLTTAPIAALGFRHSIAGSVEAFWLAARGLASWDGMIWGFMVPVLLGNIVGGVLLVALLNHGQVKHGS